MLGRRRRIGGPLATTRGWRLAVTVGLGATAGVLALPATAAAQSSSGTALSSMIVANPEPGWQPAPASTTAAITDRLEKVDSNAVGGTAVQVAVRMWARPSGDALLGVTLIQWPPGIDNYEQLMRAGFDDECVYITGNDPAATSSAPGLAGSLSALCTSLNGNAQVAVVMARKGDVTEMVEAIGVNGSSALSLATVDGIAARQFTALPAPPTDVAAIVDGVIGVLVLVSLVATLIVLVRIRRRKGEIPVPFGMEPPFPPPYGWAPPLWQAPEPAPSPDGAFAPVAAAPDVTAHAGQTDGMVPSFASFLSQPAPVATAPPGPGTPPEPALAVGWHPEGGDPYLQCYWDGTAWTSRTRWDGAQWVAVEVARLS